jgi:PAS domain-containing protein
MLTLTAPTRQATDAWSSQLQLLLESAGEGIYGIDTDGRCTFINRAAAGMLGVARKGALGRNMHQLMHRSHAEARHYGEEDCPIFKTFREGKSCRAPNTRLIPSWTAPSSRAVVTVVDISMDCRQVHL